MSNLDSTNEAPPLSSLEEVLFADIVADIQVVPLSPALLAMQKAGVVGGTHHFLMPNEPTQPSMIITDSEGMQ